MVSAPHDEKPYMNDLFMFLDGDEDNAGSTLSVFSGNTATKLRVASWWYLHKKASWWHTLHTHSLENESELIEWWSHVLIHEGHDAYAYRI